MNRKTVGVNSKVAKLEDEGDISVQAAGIRSKVIGADLIGEDKKRMPQVIMLVRLPAVLHNNNNKPVQHHHFSLSIFASTLAAWITCLTLPTHLIYPYSAGLIFVNFSAALWPSRRLTFCSRSSWNTDLRASLKKKITMIRLQKLLDAFRRFARGTSYALIVFLWLGYLSMSGMDYPVISYTIV